jgi:hypothetical protein
MSENNPPLFSWGVFHKENVRLAMPVPDKDSTKEDFERFYKNETRYGCKYMHSTYKEALQEHKIYINIMKFHRDFPKTGPVGNYRPYHELLEIFHATIREHMGNLKRLF